MTVPSQARQAADRRRDGLAIMATAGALSLMAATFGFGLLWLTDIKPEVSALPGFALGIILFALFLIPARRIGPTLIARYDAEALCVLAAGDLSPHWAGPQGSAQQQAWHGLQDWCFAGVGTGASPFWRPGALPRVDARFSVALLTGADGTGKSTMAEALSRLLDGSLQLEACGSPWARLGLRLRVKLGDILWWRARRRDDPWDSGYLVEAAITGGALARFLPRRATLLVADALPWSTLLQALEMLQTRQAEYAHPVRLLIVSSVLPPLLPSPDDKQGMAGGDAPVFDLS